MSLPQTYEWYFDEIPGEDVGGERPAAIPMGIGPGGLHFEVDERTALVLHFDEQTDVPPSDSAHNLDDLVPPAGMGLPTRVGGIIGGARQFDADQGFQGIELVEDATRLRRSMSIEVLMLPAGDGERRIIQRGAGGSSAERVLWGLRFERAAGFGTLQMYWQRADGSSATVPGVSFPCPEGWLLLGGARRWASETEVAVDYYVNGVPVGTVSSSHGDIDGGDGGTTLIGVTNV